MEMHGKSNVHKLGMFVWVLVDMKGNAIEDKYDDDGVDAPQRMWWPGLVSCCLDVAILLYLD
jgi:hypothetical protein